MMDSSVCAGKDLLFAIICNNFREQSALRWKCFIYFPSLRLESNVSISFAQEIRKSDDGKSGAGKRLEKTTAGPGIEAVAFKINEVSRLSDHTFSCPVPSARCPKPEPEPRNPFPLSDCNLLFGFICQNIFSCPPFFAFDRGGRGCRGYGYAVLHVAIASL